MSHYISKSCPFYTIEGWICFLIGAIRQSWGLVIPPATLTHTHFNHSSSQNYNHCILQKLICVVFNPHQAFWGYYCFPSKTWSPKAHLFVAMSISTTGMWENSPFWIQSFRDSNWRVYELWSEMNCEWKPNQKFGAHIKPARVNMSACRAPVSLSRIRYDTHVMKSVNSPGGLLRSVNTPPLPCRSFHLLSHPFMPVFPNLRLPQGATQVCFNSLPKQVIWHYLHINGCFSWIAPRPLWVISLPHGFRCSGWPMVVDVRGPLYSAHTVIGFSLMVLFWSKIFGRSATHFLFL